MPELVEAIGALGAGDVRLIVCGNGGASPELLQFIKPHSWCTLRPDITDDQLALELAKADLFVLATRTRIGRHARGEGFGLALLEAQIAGTPVIAPAHGGSVNAYIEGVTGLAPRDETTSTLAATIRAVLDDSDRLAWMSERAAEWSRESFAPQSYPALAAERLL